MVKKRYASKYLAKINNIRRYDFVPLQQPFRDRFRASVTYRFQFWVNVTNTDLTNCARFTSKMCLSLAM